MIKRKLLIHLPLYFIMPMLLTGCWGSINIEDRGYVVGITIDKSDGEINDSNEITLMTQFVIPAKLGGVEQSEGSAKPFSNLSASGRTLTDISQKMSSLTSKEPFYEHLKIIVFSEEIAREPGAFDSLADVFIRYHEMRRATRVIIGEGEANKILEIEPEADQIPAMYLDSLVENSDINIELSEPTRLGDLHWFLLNEDSYVIPHVKPMENRIQANGVAVFHGYDNRLVGTLNNKETKGLNLIKRTNEGGSIDFEINNYLMVYSIDQTKSSIEIDATDQDNIEIAIHIEAKGDIIEMFGSKSLLNDSYMKEMEEKINDQIEKIASETIKKAQDELKVEFFGFASILREKHYSTWEKIKDNWDRGNNLFSKSNITVSVNSEILSTGSSDRVKVKGNE